LPLLAAETGLRANEPRTLKKSAFDFDAMTDRYTHVRLHDERAALDNLPDLSAPSSEQQRVLKTGTDDSTTFLFFRRRNAE
jgi:integrase